QVFFTRKRSCCLHSNSRAITFTQYVIAVTAVPSWFCQHQWVGPARRWPIIYSMIMDVVRRCDAAYGKYQRRGSSVGATLETYMIVAAVLIGEMEGRLFT